MNHGIIIVLQNTKEHHVITENTDIVITAIQSCHVDSVKLVLNYYALDDL